MRVSPLDIRKQEFNRRTFGGYEPEEVTSFLQMLSSEWEEMRDDHRRLEEQVRSLEEKIRHYERVEEALQEALQTARDSSRKTVENAEEQARAIVATAEAEASRTKQDAVAERDLLESDVDRLHHQRRELIARLRGFLSSELEMLEQFAANGRRMTSPSGRRESTSRVRPSAPEPTRRPQPEPVEPEPEPDVRPRTDRNDDEDQYADWDDEGQAEGVPAEPPQQTDHPGRPAFNVSHLVRGPAADEEEPGDIIDNWPEEEVEEDYDAFAQAPTAGGEQDETTDERKAREATEEIAKIRRILNDLD